MHGPRPVNPRFPSAPAYGTGPFSILQMHSTAEHSFQQLPCPDDLEKRLERPPVLSATSSLSSLYRSVSSESLRTSTSSNDEDMAGYAAPNGERELFTSGPQSQIHSNTLKKSGLTDDAATSSSHISAQDLKERLSKGASVHQIQPRPFSEGPQSQSRSSPPSAMSFSDRLLSKVSRRRGRSTTYLTDNDGTGTAPEDSDATHSGAASSSTVRSRVRARLRSLRSVKSSGLSAEIRDSTRSAPLTASASLSNLRLASPTSPGFSPRTTGAPLPEARVSKETKRLRSQSVGPPSKMTSKILRRLSSGHQLQQPYIKREVSIAVIGTARCGKSVFIRKGLKGRAVSSEEHASASIKVGGQGMEAQYSRWEARLSNDFSVSTRLIVYEYDSRYWGINENGGSHSAWPAGLPRPDSAFVCFDESNRASFQDVVQLIASCKTSGIPCIAIACKCDLEKRVSPEEAARAAEPFGCKLIEVSQNLDDGKKRMRRAFDVLVQQIIAIPGGLGTKARRRTSNESSNRTDSSPAQGLSIQIDQITVPNVPCPSPSLLQPVPPLSPSQKSQKSLDHSSSPPLSPATSSILSPTRARSMNDIIAEHSKSLTSITYDSDRESTRIKSFGELSKAKSLSRESFSNHPNRSQPVVSHPSPTDDAPRDSTSTAKTQRQNGMSIPLQVSPWVTLEELIDAVMFFAVSGDDPTFITNFLLTYRRFATPRSILLGMQKRMNELNHADNVTLAAFAQMRICNLLSKWSAEYPHDFVVPGTSGAFHALIRNILSQSHTLASYGAEFLAFIDTLAHVIDEDEAWTYKSDSVSVSETDTEHDSIFDPDTETGEQSPASSHSLSHSRTTTFKRNDSQRSSARSRRASLPLSAITFIKSHASSSSRFFLPESNAGPSTKDLLLTLHRTATNLSFYDSDRIAQEITRRDSELFVRIKRRDWLRHTFSRTKKDPDSDPIARFNSQYNHLHEWAVSLILCHDKPKSRTRQVEKLAEVASRLRMLNNYSSLRAIITAINQSTFPGDTVMESFRMKTDLYKKYLSSDVLLRTTGAHQSYRMALRNTKGPCIPSLEVHLSDLRRADEGNADSKLDDPTKINWAKHKMIGQFISYLTDIQERCTAHDGYRFTEQHYLALLLDIPVMDYEMQQSRVTPPADDALPSLPSNVNLPPASSKETSILKRLLQW